MKWAFVIYALASFNVVDKSERDTAELISWGLPFPSMNDCIGFYNRYKPELLSGVEVHAKSKYDESAEIEEAGCVKVILDNEGNADEQGERVILYTK